MKVIGLWNKCSVLLLRGICVNHTHTHRRVAEHNRCPLLPREVVPAYPALDSRCDQPSYEHEYCSDRHGGKDALHSRIDAQGFQSAHEDRKQEKVQNDGDTVMSHDSRPLSYFALASWRATAAKADQTYSSD